MIRIATLGLALLVTASSGFAPAPIYRERRGSPEDELKNLQGKWILLSRTREGKNPSHSVHAVVVKGNQWTFFDKGGTWHASWLLSLDAKNSPKHIDMRGDGHKDTSRGIYEVRGDTLQFAFEMNTKMRPTNFRGDSPKWYVDVYRREKP